jgi:hypothetical protein
MKPYGGLSKQSVLIPVEEGVILTTKALILGSFSRSVGSTMVPVTFFLGRRRVTGLGVFWFCTDITTWTMAAICSGVMLSGCKTDDGIFVVFGPGLAAGGV